jgi:hypothetical protein
MVVVRETPRATRTTCWSGSFTCRVYIDSSHRNTLEYEWSLVCCCHLVICLVYCCCLEDEYGYGYGYGYAYVMTKIIVLLYL